MEVKIMDDEGDIGDIYCPELGTFCNGLLCCIGCPYYRLYEHQELYVNGVCTEIDIQIEC